MGGTGWLRDSEEQGTWGPRARLQGWPLLSSAWATPPPEALEIQIPRETVSFKHIARTPPSSVLGGPQAIRQEKEIGDTHARKGDRRCLQVTHAVCR